MESCKAMRCFNLQRDVRSTLRNLAILGLGLWLAGCARVTNPGPEAASPAIQTDDAMALRDWEPVSCYYANTTVVATPTYYTYAAKTGMASWTYPVVDTPIFLLDFAIAPVEMFVTPPNANVAYRSASYEPTYTAAPPLVPLTVN